MNFFTALLAQMPDAVAKGLIWGLMALGVYITYKILDFPDPVSYTHLTLPTT